MSQFNKVQLTAIIISPPEHVNEGDRISSGPTGNTCFVLTEIYETEAGVADHIQQSRASWQDFPALGQWM